MMTPGERMVWAAAFALAYGANLTAKVSARRGVYAVQALRDLKEDPPDLGLGQDAADMLAEMLTGWENPLDSVPKFIPSTEERRGG